MVTVNKAIEILKGTDVVLVSIGENEPFKKMAASECVSFIEEGNNDISYIEDEEIKRLDVRSYDRNIVMLIK